MKVKRPLLLYILVFVFLIFAVISIAGAVGTLHTWNWLSNFIPVTTSIYNIFKNVFLSLVWMTAALSLWLQTSWSIRFGMISSILTTLWFWMDRMLLTQNPLPIIRHLLPMIITLVILACILFSLAVLAPVIRPALPERESNNPSNQQPLGG